MRIETIRVRAVIVAVAGVLLVAPTGFAQDLSARFDEYMRAAAQASFTGTVLVSRDGLILNQGGTIEGRKIK
jgi:hypothetical protein